MTARVLGLALAGALAAGTPSAGFAQQAQDTAAMLYSAGQAAFAEGTPEAYERAAGLFKEAVAAYRRSGHRSDLALALAFVAQAYRFNGPPDSVMPYALEAREIWERDEDLEGVGLMDWALADALAAMGREEEAIVRYRAAASALSDGGSGSEAASIRYQLGLLLFERGNAVGALESFEAALGRPDALVDPADRAEVHHWVGASLLALDRLDLAVAHFDSVSALTPPAPGGTPRPGILIAADRFARQFSDAVAEGSEPSATEYAAWAARLYAMAGHDRQAVQYLNLAGSALFGTGTPGSAAALPYLRRALAIASTLDDPVLVATTYANLGRAHTYTSPDSALTYHGLAAEAAARAGDRDAEASAFAARGSLFQRGGWLDSAAISYHAALEIARATGDRSGVAFRLGDVASLHRALGRPDSAAHYRHRQLEVWEALAEAPTNPPATRRDTVEAVMRLVGIFDENLAGTLSSLAELELRAGMPDSARHYAVRAATIFDQSTSSAALPAKGMTYNLLGLVHAHEGRPDSALAYYSRSMDVARQLAVPGVVATVASNMAGALIALGQVDSAQVLFQRALAITRETGRPSAEATVLSNIAYFHHRQKAEQDLVRATAYYDSATVLLATLGSRTGDDAAHVSFAEQGFTETEEFALAWLGRAPEVGSRTASLAALAAAERGRAQALLDLLRWPDAEGEVVPGAVDAEPGGDLAAEGDSLARAVAATGVAALSYLATTDTLITWLILPSGEVEVDARPISQDSLTRLAGRLRAAIGADAPQARARLGLRSALLAGDPGDQAGNRGFELGYDGGDPGPWGPVAAALAEALLPTGFADRVAPGVEVVVLPQGPLAILPFAALPVGADRLLGRRHPLRYAPSLRSLLEVQRMAPRFASQRRGTALPDALVVGNPTMPEGLRALPGSGEEGRWRGERLGSGALTGSAATELAVKQRLPDAPLVHLATHGLAYSFAARARDSWIALSPVGREGEPQHEDGLLRVSEILDQVERVAAELVVLSACQTGLGNLRQAEGTVGLQRAFLAKGARSVLVSLWSVSDEATALLMRHFYDHWLTDPDSPSKAEALRRAQEDVRTHPDHEFAEPRFWAAFQLVGAN